MRLRVWHRVVFLVVILTNVCGVYLMSQPVAKEGVLDLRTYSFMDEGIFKVEGEWEFFWNELIDPLSQGSEKGVMVPVPKAWRDLGDYVPGIGSYGYASYRLKVLLPEDVRSLSIGFTNAIGGSGYYANGKNIGYRGFPGNNRHQYEFDLRPSQFNTPAKDSVVLVVHLSNFDHYSGGLRGAVELGIPVQVYTEKSKIVNGEFFMLGSVLMIGLFFFIQYRSRPDKYRIFFSMICFAVALRIVVMSGADFGIFSWLSGVNSLRLEYFSFAIIVTFFVLLLRSEFENEFSMLVFRIIMWILTGILILVVIAPLSLFSKLIAPFLAFVGVIGMYELWVLILAAIRGRKGAIGYLIGLLLSFSGVANDALYFLDVIHIPYLSYISMFVFLLIYAMTFSSKSNYLINQSELMSQEIASMNRNLETIVGKRTFELKEKSDLLLAQQKELEGNNVKLQKLVNVRNRFFTIIGHDIKGPVGANTQMLELLNSGHFGEEEEKEMIKLLMESSRATQALVENLLYWGRAQTNDLVAQAEAFDLYPFVKEVKDLFALSSREKRVDIVNEVKRKTIVHCDKQHMKLMLRNLVWNALKFSNEGGNVSIYTEVDEVSNDMMLIVKDTGIGIPRSLLPKIFSEEEFISTSGTKSEKGTGIGLKLCKEIVEANGGSIKIDSKAGEGTSITLSLPGLP